MDWNLFSSSFTDLTSQQTLMGFVLSAFMVSFLGSWHCAIMCGPIAVHMNSHTRSLASYHVGRIISYMVMGALFGALGTKLLIPENKYVFLIVLIAVLFFIFISSLARLGPLPKKLQWYYKFEQNMKSLLFQKFKINPKSSSLFVGLLTGLLPCGWLYTFYSAAILTKSAFAGAILLLIFNLGSLPALLGASQFFRKAFANSSIKQQKISGLLLMCAALYSVGLHLFHSQIWK